jgi:two-component system, NtrC family, sensor kinase
VKRRSGAGGKAIKTRRRKAATPKHRNAPKAARRPGSSTVGQETKVARLTRELNEALEQQKATAEILGAISRSRFELQPILQIVVNTAARLCQANKAVIFRLEGGVYRFAAGHSLDPAYLEIERQTPISPGPETLIGRAAMSRQVARIHDALTDPLYEKKEDAKLGGHRSMIGVPLMREGEPVGVIGLSRSRVEPFSEHEIELVTTFANQAVIAIENVRLFEAEQQRSRELTESLEQQTATAEVLRVISSSPGDLQPVFEAMLENAVRICGASFGSMFLFEGEHLRRVSMHNAPASYAEYAAREPVIHYSVSGDIRRVRNTRRPEQTPDLLAEDLNDPLAKFAGARTVVTMPMLKHEELIGIITIYRRKVRPFTDKQVELLTNFAAQAVIAIENARLLSELRESLEQQTATSEILASISGSLTDPRPVFDAITRCLLRLFGARFATVQLLRDGAIEMVAADGQAAIDKIMAHYPRPLDDTTVGGQAMLSKQVVQYAPVIDNPLLPLAAQQIGRDYQYNSIIAAPMIRQDKVVGAIVCGNPEPRVFDQNEVVLIKSFADQAVIAIENTRLLNELRQRTTDLTERTADLTEALEQQTATSEVLQVISSSAGDLQPVFETMLGNAVRICDAKFGGIYRIEANTIRLVATHADVPAAYAGARRFAPFRPSTKHYFGRMMADRTVMHVVDTAAEQGYVERRPEYVAAVELGGVRTFMAVPMLKENEAIGAFLLARQEVRPFTGKQIALVTNFAAQAVIAIENTRLLNELRQRTDELAQRQAELSVTFDNMGDGVVMFNEEMRLAAWNRNLQEILDLPDSFFAEPRTYRDYMTYLIEHGEFGDVDLETELRRYIESADRERRVERTRPDGRVLEVRVNPVPGGGFVAIYSDVTERKKAEERVRAARDAAESALRELKSAQDRLVQTEKLASLGQLTAGIAHEIKNPLNFVNNFSAVSVELIDELREALGGVQLDGKLRAEINAIADMLQGNLDKVVQHGKRADTIVKNMLLHSRKGSGEHRPVDINELVEESLNLAYHGARAEKQGFNIALERSFDPAAGEVDLFPQEMTRVLLNLISNGFYAATKRKAEASGADYEPTLSAATKNLGDSVEITIRDNGTGIPPEVKEKMFNPFFTTKPAGEGTGLGLSLSYDIIVKQHFGSVVVDTLPGEFTEFRIVLPRTGAPLIKSGERS